MRKQPRRTPGFFSLGFWDFIVKFLTVFHLVSIINEVEEKFLPVLSNFSLDGDREHLHKWTYRSVLNVILE